MVRAARIAVLCFSVALISVAPLAADVTEDQVLIVVNESSDLSIAIGDYYAAARGIAADHIFRLPDGTTTSETINRSTYSSQIRDPLIEFLEVTRPDLKDEIVYIVLTKDVPIRVANSGGSGTNQSAASVDSELTQLFTGNVGDDGQQGRILNPLYNTYNPPELIARNNISYLVFRLDGYQTDVDGGSGVPADIKQIIDDSLNPASSGQVLLDAKAASGDGDSWMVIASQILTEMGVPHVLDTTSTFQSNHEDLIGYCSWGSNDPSDAGAPYYGEVPPGSGNFYPGFFKPGAVCSTYVSTSARTFTDGNQNYGQSLIADLHKIDATATNGHVYEPYLDAVARPQILFPQLFQDQQCGTVYYRSIRWLSWENIIICDPLMKSPIVAFVPPRLDSVNPTRIPCGETIDNFSLSGDHFTGKFDMKIKVGGVKARRLDVISRKQMTCDLPPIPSGVHDVFVKTFMGDVTVEKLVVAYPAMDLNGNVDLGETVTMTLHGTQLDTYLTFFSLGTAQIPFPPYGDLLLDPSRGLFLLLAGILPANSLDLQGMIPDDPVLSGISLYFQSLIGADILVDGKLTNLITMAIP